MSTALPASAEIVIIGGGMVGCSVAYHLTQIGRRDVVLLEQGRLTCGTTWHAAGLVGQLRAHQNMTRLVQYSIELYARSKPRPGWPPAGSSAARHRRAHARAHDAAAPRRRLGDARRASPATIISVEAAAERYPVMRTDDLLGALWLPGDGKANPADVTQALAKGARMRGARIFEKTKRHRRSSVKDGARDRRRDRRAATIEAEVVVNCAGQWAKAGRAHVRRHRAAAFGRAHVHRHRPHRRRASGPAGDARPRRLHLLQGGGRRPADGRLRAGGQALGDGRHPGAISSSSCCPTTGTSSRS